MPDIITSEERAAIDAAIDAGQVTQCAIGDTAYNCVWDEGSQQLRLKNQDKNPWNGGRASAKRAKPGQRAETRDRRELVRKLAAKGRNRLEIARHARVNEKTILTDARALGITIPRSSQHDQKPTIANKIREAYSPEKTIREIAAEVGVTYKSANASLARLRLVCKREGRGSTTPDHILESQKERRQTVQQLLAQGIKKRRIAERLGVATSTITRDIRAMASRGVS